MKKLWVIVLAGWVFVMSQGFRTVAADDEGTQGIPLRKLAGTYSATVQGSFFLCFVNAPPFPLAKCGSPGSIGVPLSFLEVGVATRDAEGNTCATLTETVADLPVDISPPFVAVRHSVGRVTSYDPTTGTGDGSVTSYAGGQCHGSTFDSTGATVVSTSTSHFAASNRGKRVDEVATSLTDPVGAVGDFSASATELRE